MILSVTLYILIVNLGLRENNMALAKEFKHLPGTSFNATDKIAEFQSCRLDHCLDLCRGRPLGNTVEWTPSEKMCRFYKNSANDTTFFTPAPTDLYIAMVSEWTLVFHATAGISQRIAELWTTPGATNLNSWDGDLSNPAAPASTHYKSELIDIWESINPSEVKFVLYKDGREVVHLDFNGTESDQVSWFTLETYESGTLGDIHSEMKNCSGSQCFKNIEMFGQYDRNFHIYLQYNYCPGDIGWMVVADDCDVCQYAKGHWPTFVYSKTGSPLFFRESALVDNADTLAVFVTH